MDQQITNHRKDLKNYLSGSEYITFIDLVLSIPGRVIQKLTSKKRMISFYWSAAIICVSILVVGYGLSALGGNLNASNLEDIKIEFLGVGLAYLSLVIFKNARNSVLEKISNNVIDEINSEKNLNDLEKWLKLFSNVRAHALFCLIYVIFFGFGLREDFVGYGSYFLVFSIAFIWGIPMYFLLTFILLPYRLGKYEFHLYTPDPSSSKIIYDLSRLFQGLVYLYAIVAFGSMIFIAYSGLLPVLFLPSLFVAWLPIIALFVINQYALSNIIFRGKLKTLIEIQMQIVNIQKNEELAKKDSMEKVVRLMDYHDRIKTTKNAVFDLRAGLDFLNSLLLPVIGFFIGNMNTILAIFDNI